MKRAIIGTITAAAALGILLPIPAPCQQVDSPDNTAHRIQFVEIEKDVSLEVVDWGGNGPPVVLLAGLGGTAHSYDQFAPRLVAGFHVYGITRRGFGASGAPATGYGMHGLAKDVEDVIDALHLQKPLVVGHSIAGQELDIVGAEYADRIKGLVYLDAAFDYTVKDSEEIERLLAEVSTEAVAPKEKHSSYLELNPVQKIVYNSRREKPDYAAIKSPALAIVAVPRDAAGLFEDYTQREKSVQSKMDRILELTLERVHLQEQEFASGVKGSRTMEIVGAQHGIYRSNEAEVLKAIIDFAQSLVSAN